MTPNEIEQHIFEDLADIYWRPCQEGAESNTVLEIAPQLFQWPLRAHLVFDLIDRILTYSLWERRMDRAQWVYPQPLCYARCDSPLSLDLCLDLERRRAAKFPNRRRRGEQRSKTSRGISHLFLTLDDMYRRLLLS